MRRRKARTAGLVRGLKLPTLPLPRARGAVVGTVIKQGEAGESFYIIKSGTVKVTQTQDGSSRVETLKDELKSGDYFGEIALLEDGARMATVSATSDVVCMSLDRDTFTKHRRNVSALHHA